eukprot:665089-Rhodomonas_salina.2
MESLTRDAEAHKLGLCWNSRMGLLLLGGGPMSWSGHSFEFRHAPPRCYTFTMSRTNIDSAATRIRPVGPNAGTEHIRGPPPHPSDLQNLVCQRDESALESTRWRTQSVLDCASADVRFAECLRVWAPPALSLLPCF